LLLSACSGAIIGNLAQSNFQDEPDELRDSCTPDDDDCVPGLTDTLLAVLTKRVIEGDLARPENQKTSNQPTLGEAEIKTIIRKPDQEKTARDREIEALLEELLEQRRKRLKQQAAS